MGTYVTPAKQMQNWCQPPASNVEFDSNHEPTAADHGNVLYVIKKDPVIGRYMIAARDIKPGEVIFTDQPAVVGELLRFLQCDRLFRLKSRPILSQTPKNG